MYTHPLHDALPISPEDGDEERRRPKPWLIAAIIVVMAGAAGLFVIQQDTSPDEVTFTLDRKSTRLNSSHVAISYAVFCLKKKNRQKVVGNDREDGRWRGPVS